MGENSPTWLGTSLSDMYRGQGPWCFSVPPVIPSKYHKVLYEIPATLQTPPKPHINGNPKHWDDDHVRMPYSPENLFIIKQNDHEIIETRWKIIKEALSQPIRSVTELERAINSYNNKLAKFTALHRLFNEVLDEAETVNFFDNILPGIIQLALQLPEIVPGSLPLLKRHHCRSISLSQLQIASLLANAFLCTFVWRRNIALNYPHINFVRLFAADERVTRQSCVTEKLKCICHYFRRVTTKKPLGCVMFERKYVPRNQMPRWDSVDNNLGNTRVHISSTGMIEDAQGFVQVDFANKYVGGGVLGYGCVQEEIRFVICPELIISRLFTEELSDSEAIVITGVERYSSYTGYGDTFKWTGNVNDDTPFDEYGRRRTTVAVIDATYFNKTKDQFQPSAILRELNKAYVGFSCREKTNIAPIASGNWGCGAFRGDPNLKSLIQLMACSAANRDLVYYSFGNTELMKQFYNMHLFLATNRITICMLWRCLCRFCASDLQPNQLYSFIQQCHFDTKSQPSVKQFFTFMNKKSKNDTQNDTKSTKNDSNNLSEAVISPSTSSISSSSSSSELWKNSKKRDSLTTPTDNQQASSKASTSRSSDEIIHIIDMIDGNCNKRENIDDSETTLLNEIDKLGKIVGKNIETPMEIDCEEDVKQKTSFIEEKRKKITDYFCRISKSN